MVINLGDVEKWGGTSLATAELDRKALEHSVNSFTNNSATLKMDYGIIVCSGSGKTDDTSEGRKATDHAIDLVNGTNQENEWKILENIFKRNVNDHGLEQNILDPLLNEAKTILNSGDFDGEAKAKIVGLPERVKATIFYELGKKSFPGLDFVLLDYDQNGIQGINSSGNTEVLVCHQETLQNIVNVAKSYKNKIIILPGFIGTKSRTNEMITLERGMSDGTATYWGGALYLDEVRIFSDYNGISPVDPKIISGLNSIDKCTYREAEAFAGLGAKIINDTALKPARERGIPVKILKSFEPDKQGTTIRAVANGKKNKFGVTAIANTADYTMITVYNMPMLKTGVAAKVGDTFAKHSYNIETINDGDSCRTYAIFAKPNLGELILDLKKQGHPVKDVNSFARVTLVGEEINYKANLVFLETLNELCIKPKIFQFCDDSIIVDAFIREQYVHNVVTKLYNRLFEN